MSLKKHESALTIEEQVNNLKSLNLIIKDEQLAKDFLNDISYFRFIKSFSIGLKPKNGNYYDNISFKQLEELYLFNAEFRQILFTQIEKVEINLRCRISNYFCLKYGVLGYKDSNNFSNRKYHTAFLNEISIEINRNKRVPFIYNFRNNYIDGDIPLYALVEIISFGTLSKLFKNMHNADKKIIALTYNVSYTYFESWIESISYIRNICAHYGRLYNAKLTKTPKLYQQYTKKHISNIRIFGVLCCIKHLVKNDIHWTNFVKKLEKLFQQYSYVDKNTMGFPADWKDILLI
ncbi:Abi family protein [Megamonas funiformis]|jgi:abortive infection bacteriophage resistance protein|uniref:Abi family protein n=1 Tax=Megamonas funiformis TaxID=437897 RepID=UPI0026761C75|nr:Abi family protein [Megamonas funiformis]